MSPQDPVASQQEDLANVKLALSSNNYSKNLGFSRIYKKGYKSSYTNQSR